MNLVDANVLLYAVNADAEHHARSREWLDSSLNGSAAVGFSWIALLAFVRLSTKAGLFPTPMTVGESFGQVEEWLAAPSAMLVEPTARHVEVLGKLLRQLGTGGNVVNDAHIAALAIEHKATVVTFDSDFARFPGVRIQRP